jgi:Fe-S-cluster-containing dehydrogenase component
MKMIVDEKRCTGCRSCELACSFQQTDAFGSASALIAITADSRKHGFFRLEVCRHCADMPCAVHCPASAIERDDQTGYVHINTEKCTGCGICTDTDVCRWSAPKVISSIARICDGCNGDPLCIRFCNPGALSLELDPAER